MKRPSLLLYFLEVPRAIFERIQSNKFLKKYTPEKRADGHPVFVIPGFMASDFSTKPLRKFFDRIGYKTFGWGLGRNLGRIGNLEVLSKKLDAIYQKDNQKITLIGWSLGGVYARELAKKNPNQIRQIITLGSPFSEVTAPNNAMWLFKLINPEEIDPDWLAELEKPAPVPTVAIYSETDGIVPWRACIEKVEDELHENVEVHGSHFGLGVNKEVLDILVHRIQKKEAAQSLLGTRIE